MLSVPANWMAISATVRRLWMPGLVAIRERITGKSYFFAAKSVGKRVRDQHELLVAGRHHCRELQVQWTARPTNFEYFFIRTTNDRRSLAVLKQVEIDAARATNGCYNKKNSLAREGRHHRLHLLSEFPALRKLLSISGRT